MFGGASGERWRRESFKSFVGFKHFVKVFVRARVRESAVRRQENVCVCVGECLRVGRECGEKQWRDSEVNSFKAPVPSFHGHPTKALGALL